MRAVSSQTTASRHTRVTVLENQPVKDSLLGQRSNWVPDPDRVYDVDIQPVRAQPKVDDAGKVTAVEMYDFYLPYSAEIGSANRLQTEDGAVYEIVNTNGKESQKVNLVVTVALIDGGS